MESMESMNYFYKTSKVSVEVFGASATSNKVSKFSQIEPKGCILFMKLSSISVELKIE